jgi:hypothetical protein
MGIGVTGSRFLCTGGISTFDYDLLTKLIFFAHERYIQVEIASGSSSHVSLRLHRRHNRNSVFLERYPTIEEVLALHKKRWSSPGNVVQTINESPKSANPHPFLGLGSTCNNRVEDRFARFTKTNMKIKVLECPRYVKSDFYSATLKKYWTEITPIFCREGRYLINNQKVIIESENKAWQSTRKEVVSNFFEDLRYDRDINILSHEQAQAILVLMRAGLATAEQASLYGKDYIRKKHKKHKLQRKLQAKL